MKTFDDCVSVSRGFSRWNILSARNGYEEGEIGTPNGFVSVYIQGDEEHFHLTRLGFIWEGKMHMRNFYKRYTRRGAVTKAKQFAEEIVNG